MKAITIPMLLLCVMAACQPKPNFTPPISDPAECGERDAPARSNYIKSPAEDAKYSVKVLDLRGQPVRQADVVLDYCPDYLYAPERLLTDNSGLVVFPHSSVDLQDWEFLSVYDYGTDRSGNWCFLPRASVTFPLAVELPEGNRVRCQVIDWNGGLTKDGSGQKTAK